MLKKIVTNINNEKNDKRIINLLLLTKIRNDDAYYKNNTIDKLNKQIHSIGIRYLYYIIYQKIPTNLTKHLGNFGL